MKPNEFWNSTYREISKFCSCQLVNYFDLLKELIIIQDASTDKLIKADPLLNKRPKVESLKKVFKNLFKKDDF